MADKMIRIAGREIVGGTAQPISMLVDDDGNYAVRVVDAAPFAYDAVNDELKVRATVQDDWTPYTIVDNTAAISKTYTVPAGYEYLLQSLSVLLETDATVANRLFYLCIDNGTNDIYRNIFDVAIPASQTRTISVAPMLPLSAAFNSVNRATMPIPVCNLKEGYRVRLWLGGSTGAGDAVRVSRHYLSRAV